MYMAEFYASEYATSNKENFV